MIRMKEARWDGRTTPNSATQEELEALNAQRHDYFSDWSDEEKAKFESERAAMWAQIPPHLRQKAEKLARGADVN